MFKSDGSNILENTHPNETPQLKHKRVVIIFVVVNVPVHLHVVCLGSQTVDN